MKCFLYRLSVPKVSFFESDSESACQGAYKKQVLPLALCLATAGCTDPDKQDAREHHQFLASPAFEWESTGLTVLGKHLQGCNNTHRPIHFAGELQAEILFGSSPRAEMASNSSATQEFIMNYAAPGVGTLFSTMLTLGPMSAILTVRKTENIGDVNPDPFPVLFANCIAW